MDTIKFSKVSYMRYIRINIKKEIIFIFVITISGVFLRLYHLGFHDFWYDEVYSIITTTRFWQDWPPPLYFAFLHYWIKVFGTSEFSLRFPSLIFSSASIPLLFLLGRRIFNAKIGIYSSLFIGLSAFHLWYAQEARPYSLSVFLGLLSTYSLYRALTEKKNKFWFYFILFSALGLYSNISYSNFFLLVAQLLSMQLFIKRRVWIKTLFVFIIIFFSFLPHLPKFMARLHYVRDGFWIIIPTLNSFAVTLENFNLGYNMPFIMYWLSGIWVCCPVIRGVFIALRQGNKNMLFILLLFTVPIISIFIVSKIFVPIYLDRSLIIFSPYYYLMFALGIESLNKYIKTPLVIISILLFLTAVYGYHKDWMPLKDTHHQGVHLKKPFKPAINFIETNFRSGDIVSHTNFASNVPFEFYSQKKEITQYILFAPGAIETCSNRPYYSTPKAKSAEDIVLEGNNRLWVVFCDWERSGNLDENANAVKESLDNKFKLDLAVEFEGLRIFRYVKF